MSFDIIVPEGIHSPGSQILAQLAVTSYGQMSVMIGTAFKYTGTRAHIHTFIYAYIYMHLFNEPMYISIKTYKSTIKTVYIDNKISRPMTALTDINITWACTDKT